jgi:hypothetical protein
VSHYTLVVVGFVFVFALTMAGDEGTMDDQLQNMRTWVDGLATDMKMMYERPDSTITSSNEWFDQLDLTQMATKTTLDNIVSRLDALNTMIMELQKDYGSDTEQEEGTHSGRARRDRVGVPDLSVSGDNFDLVEDDPHDPTTTSEPEAPMQSLNQLPVVTDLIDARSA